MLSQNFVWVALVIIIAANWFYLKDTLNGSTKPNRVTFFLWAAAPLIGYLSQRTSGGGIQILYTLAIAFVPFTIFVASFVSKGAYWAITKFDLGCGLLSVIALVLLVATGNGLLALLLSIAADFFATLPTIIKAYRYPETETMVTYAIEIVSSVLVLLTVQRWIFIDYSFALYFLAITLILAACTALPKIKTLQ